MPSLQDLVESIRHRPGITAAVVVGRDGLVIAADARDDVDADEVGARVPVMLDAADHLCGPGTTSLVEHADGRALISTLGDDAALLVLADRETDLAPLALDVRRFRDHIAALV